MATTDQPLIRHNPRKRSTRGVLITVLVAIMVSSCGFTADPQAHAAHLLKQKMKSPASFSVVSSKVMWHGNDNKGRDAYIVKVDYDAANSFGAVLRDCKLVSFAYDHGQYYAINPFLTFFMCGNDNNPMASPEAMTKRLVKELHK